VQLNTILETRETARGLIVNVSDVLFDFNSANLKPGAREKVARLAGILNPIRI
jgi:outer membrane protein OmpA-like peptidoglycan-associated protein